MVITTFAARRRLLSSAWNAPMSRREELNLKLVELLRQAGMHVVDQPETE